MENIEKYTDEYLNDIILNGKFEPILSDTIRNFLNLLPKEKIILLYSVKEQTYLLGYWKNPSLYLIKRRTISISSSIWIKCERFTWGVGPAFTEEYYHFELGDRQSVSNIPICCGKEMEYLSLAYKCPECWRVCKEDAKLLTYSQKV